MKFLRHSPRHFSTRRATALVATLALIWGVSVPTIGEVGAQDVCTIVGTAGDDVLIGTDGDDVLCGGDGDDMLIGGFGADTLRGEDGNDVLVGGIGNDRLQGGQGDDRLSGGGGHDALEGGPGADELVGGFTNDSLNGGAGADTCDDDGTDQLAGCESGFAGNQLRIMTLGDSITEGFYPGGKYRKALAERLDDRGCRYDYVGSVLDQQLRWGDSYDPDHEGHGGLTADDLLARAPGWFATESPDVVILHAGTNDFYRGHTTESTVADIEAIIAAARVNNPAMTIVVARIIPGDFIEDGVLELNAALDVAIPALDQPASRVVLVDQHAGFDLDLHTHDQIHPNHDGARIMGDRFWAALEPLIASSCFAAAAATPGPTTTVTLPTTSTTVPATTTTDPVTTTPSSTTAPSTTTIQPPATTIPATPAGSGLSDSFASSGRHLDPLAGGAQVAVHSDGGLVGVATLPTIGDYQITRLDSSGSLDVGFGDSGTPGKKRVSVPLPWYSDDIFGPMGAGVVDDGDLVTIFSSDIGAILVRTDPDGNLDPSYAGNGVLDHLACGNAIDGEVASDGAAVVLGYPMDFQQANAECDGTVVRRYTPAGQRDSSWGNQGRSGVSLSGAHFDDRMYPSAIDLRGNDDVVVAGSTSDGSRVASILRVTNGNANNGFGSGGFVAFDPDPSGSFATFQSFGGGAIGSFTQGHATKQAMDVAFDASGNIVTVGTTCASSDAALRCTAQTGIWIARHLSNGTPDQSFGVGGVARLDPTANNDYGLTVEVVPSGKIAVGGFTGPDPLKQFVMVLETDGTPDAGFGGGDAIVGGFGEPASENQQPRDVAAHGDRIYVAASRFDSSIFGYGSHISAYDVSAETQPTTTAPPAATTTTAPPITIVTPATTTTTAPAPQPVSNLIENPSIETATNPWSQDSWGDLDATFTWLNEGSDGTKSLRVRVTNHVWGDAKWVSNKAPTTPDTTYLYTESYRATAGTHLVAHHVKTDGTSTYTWIGSVPASANWTTHSVPLTTPPNTTHTRVFHVIGVIGTLDIDNAILHSQATTTSPPPTTTAPPATTTTTNPPTTTTTAPPPAQSVVRTVTGPAGLVFPHELATDNNGVLYLSDFFQHRVYRIDTATGERTVVAGSGTSGYRGDGGPAAQAELDNPVAMAFDAANNLYIADHGNHVVRRVDATTGAITTVAGTGDAGDSGDGGPATSARLDIPEAVAVSSTHLYIGDWGAEKVRRVDLVTGIIDTFATIPYVSALAVDAGGDVYVSSMYPDVIYKLTPNGTQSTFVGKLWTTGSSGDGGPASNALINHANGLDVAPDGSLIISDSYNGLIRRVDAATGIITTIVGTGVNGNNGDGGPPLAADIDPDGVAVGLNGEIYWAQPGHHYVRSVTIS